jgi:hypothetical protein
MQLVPVGSEIARVTVTVRPEYAAAVQKSGIDFSQVLTIEIAAANDDDLKAARAADPETTQRLLEYVEQGHEAYKGTRKGGFSCC